MYKENTTHTITAGNIDEYNEHMFVFAFNMKSEDIADMYQALSNNTPNKIFYVLIYNAIDNNDKNINKKRLTLFGHCFIIMMIKYIAETNTDIYQSEEKYLKFISGIVNNPKFAKLKAKNLTDLQRKYIDKCRVIFAESTIENTFDTYWFASDAENSIKNFFEKNKIPFEKNKIPYGNVDWYLYFMYFFMFALIINLIYFVFFFDVF